ncbi:hypothetical protein ATANTOWER_000403 [Ataeniobius toweri]|uniref:Uncharacterized protein n=1 Tax=Ataeniobius toweri TaxID=208326 RepID=A0ABU7BZ20_9TELE|nr:hypothetical protein [Ataeniobius toweri]
MLLIFELQDTSPHILWTQPLFLESCSLESGGPKWKETTTSRTQEDYQESKHLGQPMSPEKTFVSSFKHFKDMARRYNPEGVSTIAVHCVYMQWLVSIPLQLFHTLSEYNRYINIFYLNFM